VPTGSQPWPHSCTPEISTSMFEGYLPAISPNFFVDGI
jgi:hypothetical protein